MSEIVLDDVSKRWGETAAVDRISTTAEAGRFLVLLGPSGCGKSTTLRMIAGLEDVTAGRVLIDGRDVTGLPPAKRSISMVFQSYALFPHLSVAENIIFGLRVRRTPKDARARKLDRVAGLVGLAEHLHRKPAQLSGGQRQRVALARAIIAENPICLMDEPLSNLDAKLRQEMRAEIRELQDRLGMTMVYVTHDQDEAMSLADKVILMNGGRIEQEAAPADLYERPATVFAAGFIGSPPMNLLPLGRLAGVEDAPGGEIAGLVARSGEDGLLGVRPEDMRLSNGEGLPAILRASDYRGADTIVIAELAGQRVAVRAPGRVAVRPGEPVRLCWGSGTAHLFDGASGRRIEDAGDAGPRVATAR